MADLVRIKTGALGSRAEMPKLQYDSEKGSELGYRTDEEALYIGTKDGNVRLCGSKDIAEINRAMAETNNAIESIIARLIALETPSE